MSCCVGALSVTAATVSYFVALCMFFKPDAKIKALRVASFAMLILFLASVACVVIRWFQVLTNKGKLGENNYYHKKRKQFRIAQIVLGAMCTLFVLVSAAGIFLFASAVTNLTGGLKDRSNSMFSTADNSSSNATITNSTDTQSGGFREKNVQRSLQRPNAEDTSGLQTRNKRLENSRERNLSECRRAGNCRDGEESTESSLTTEPIPDDKDHCRNRTAYPRRKDRNNCLGREGLKQKVTGFVKDKYIMSGFLGVSFIGHLINVCVALCCHGDPADPEEEGYEEQEQSEKEEKEEKEETV
ncbi:uncharacterized protein LOC134819982 [Bolinopsis microptera]|uniref:uncharacterized protein LOC134819982 n=1 Tax=Bolinopsis microptera TaxID=2820187 RepID=UPI003078B447